MSHVSRPSANKIAGCSSQDVVARLSELVEVASTALRQHSTEHSSENWQQVPSRTEDTLHNLYPSLGPTAARSAMQSSSRVGGTCQTRPSANFHSNFKRNGTGNRSRSRKKSRVEEKETMSYKDVFFMNDPKISKVPRRQDRQHFYDHGLVGSAVAFTSSMQEGDIRGAISASIPHLKEMQIKPEFEQLKAVGPKLVSVPEIKEWNYKILKHQTDQGPLYVRAFTFVNVGMSLGFLRQEVEDGSDTDDDNNDDIYLQTTFDGKNDPWTTVHPPPTELSDEVASTDDVSGHDADLKADGCEFPSLQMRKPEEVRRPSETQKKQCPICWCFFPAQSIQAHSNDSIDAKMKPEIQLYNDLMFEHEL